MAEVKIAADSGGGSVGLAGPSATTGNAAVQFKLPVADGSANQLLKTDGSGNLGWATDSAGKVLQVVQTVKTDTWSEDLSNASYSAVVSGLTVDIIPASSSNKVLITASVAVSQEHGDRVGVSITKGGATIDGPKGAGSGNRVGVGFTSGVSSSTQAGSVPVMYLDSPSATSQQTYGIKIMQGSGGTSEVYVNAQATGDSNEANRFRYVSTITAMEISA